MIRALVPHLNIFERIVATDDIPGVLALEALTNPRLNPSIGPLAYIDQSDYAVGPGADYIMASFAYPGDSRFTSEDSYGVYYAAKTLETAIAEVSFHRELFARRTPTPAMDFDERVVVAAIDAAVVDIRDLPADDAIYDPDPHKYAAARAFGHRARSEDGVDGIVYRSVRRYGGECVAIFTPRVIKNARTDGYIGLKWDGFRIVDVYRKSSLSMPYPER